MTKLRRKYTRDLKMTVLRELENGKTLAQVSREYEVHPSSIMRWKREHQEDPVNAFSGNGNMYKAEARIAELERALGQSHAENLFLKKTLSKLEAKAAELRKRDGRS